MIRALERVKKRGQRLYTWSKIGCVLVGTLMNGILVLQYATKRKALLDGGLQAPWALRIDSLIIFFILVYISTLATALIIFKVVE